MFKTPYGDINTVGIRLISIKSLELTPETKTDLIHRNNEEMNDEMTVATIIFCLL